MDTGNWACITAIWPRLIADAPLHKDAPWFTQRAIHVLLKQGDLASAAALLEEMKVRYGPDSGWPAASTTSPEAASMAVR